MQGIEFFQNASFRIAIWYVALFAISVVLLGAVMSWVLTAGLMAGVHARIGQQSASLLSTYAEEGWVGLRREIRKESENATRDPDGAHYLLLDRAGRKQAGDLAAMHPFTGWSRASLQGIVSNPGTDASRDTLTIPLFGTALPEGCLIVGHGRQLVDEVQDRLFNAAGWGLALAMLLAGGGGYLMSRRIVGWAKGFNQAAGRIMVGDLSGRLPVGGFSDELDGLSGNINGMLDRIEELVEGLRQVTNDSAHDLRRPLSRLQQGFASEITQNNQHFEDRAAFDKAIHETETILDTFEALLRITEIETGVFRTRFVSVDLSSLAEEVVRACRPLAEEHGQHLAGDIESGAILCGDRSLLRQLLVHLIENSIRHAGRDARITLTIRRGTPAPRISVADTGPGIPRDEYRHVLKRFYRLERSRNTAGSGLGLALVKAVADLHRLQIELADNFPGLIVRISSAAHGDPPHPCS